MNHYKLGDIFVGSHCVYLYETLNAFGHQFKYINKENDIDYFLSNNHGRF